MNNSIFNQSLGDNNSMKSLSFFWNAIFKDGTKINQFDENNIEHRFQEVKDRFNDLVYFNLIDNKGHFFTVDLLHGIIGYNYITLPYLDLEEKKNVRLIFFRRHRVDLGQNLKEINHNINYHLGIQWNDEKNNNHKIIFIIDEDGTFIVGDK